MKSLILKPLILAGAFCAAALLLTSCAGSRVTNTSAGPYGPDGKPVEFNNGVPVSTSSNQFAPSRTSGGGG